MTPRNRRNEPDLPTLGDDVLLALHRETGDSIVHLVQFNSRLCKELERRGLLARALDGFSVQVNEPGRTP